MLHLNARVVCIKTENKITGEIITVESESLGPIYDLLAEWMSKNSQSLSKNSPKVRLGHHLYPPPNTGHTITENE